jgi:hypothetical protein
MKNEGVEGTGGNFLGGVMISMPVWHALVQRCGQNNDEASGIAAESGAQWLRTERSGAGYSMQYMDHRQTRQ